MFCSYEEGYLPKKEILSNSTLCFIAITSYNLLECRHKEHFGVKHFKNRIKR